jgi:hypothetical protein
MKLIFTCFVLLLTASAKASLTPRPAAQIPDSSFMMDLERFDEDGQNTGYNLQVISYMAANGMKWARLRPKWGQVELTPGVFISSGVDAMVENCRSNGVSMLMLLDNPDMGLYGLNGNAPTNALGMTQWLAYVDFMVRRYKGKVAAWEIWNEPNLAWHPTVSTAAYVSLAVQTAQKIRSIDPNAYIMSGGLSLNDLTYLDGIMNSSLGSYLNAVALHPYRRYPEQAQDEWLSLYPAVGGIVASTNTGAANYEGELALVRGILARHGYPNLEIWDTETGYPSQPEANLPPNGFAWDGSLSKQAKNIARLFMLNLGLGIKHTSYFRPIDIDGLTFNIYTSPLSSFVDDYRNANLLFGTMGPLYNLPGTSIPAAGSSFVAQQNTTLSGSTVTAASNGIFPNAWAQYAFTGVPPGDYQIWVRTGSTVAGAASAVYCEPNGISTTTLHGDVYFHAATNGVNTFIQDPVNLDHRNFYWTPCVYSNYTGAAIASHPVVWTSSAAAGGHFTLKLYPYDNSSFSDARLVPLGPLTEKPAMTALRTLTAIFDDRVSPAPSLSANFTQGSLSAPEWAAFRSFKYATRGGVPVIVYWFGTPTTDSLSDRTVSLSLSAGVPDAVLVDPLTGAYSSLGTGQNFTVRAQDYPLVLTSQSALDKSTNQVLVADETYNYPNPARGDATYLRYYLNQPADVTIDIFNSSRQKVFTNSFHAGAGRGVLPWSLSGVANGVYFLKITAGDESVFKKILVLR